MFTSVFIAGACLIAAWIYRIWSKWTKNYAAAKTAGYPVFISPVHLTDLWWYIISRPFIPVIKLLPSTWWDPWLPLSQVFQIWKYAHRPFEDAGSDTFILACPKGNVLWSSDSAVLGALFTQHPKSDVSVSMRKFFDIWGPTVGSTLGEEWKTHRKLITAGFNNATHSLAWKEAVHQTATLTERWIEQGSIIPVVKTWTSQLALHVISGAFFNKRLEWKGYTHTSVPVPPGHQVSYEDALFTVLDRLGYIFLMPRFLLKELPGRFKEAYVAFTDMTKYMQEMRQSAVDRIDEVTEKKNKNLLESIVSFGLSEGQAMQKDAMLGDIWFALLAGHETTGNTMAFIVLLLTLHPEYQRKIQAQLDEQLASRPRSEWSVERDLQPLQKGWVGAVQKEVMRCYSVVVWLTRYTYEPITLIDSRGTTHTIPANTVCVHDFAAAFRNPNVWWQRDISAERRKEIHDSPAEIEFIPERWLEGTEKVESSQPDVLMHFPFGRGPRSCPGRAFAEIEMTAFMATIFKDYSFELVVDEQTLRECNGDKQTAYKKTRDAALRRMHDEIEANINIQMLKEIPIRIVRRGIK